jgi:hypothetical protein
MACCVLIAELLSRVLRLFRRDAQSRTDPEVLRSVTAAPPH